AGSKCRSAAVSAVPRCAILSVGSTEALPVKRRAFITLIGGAAAAWPLRALSQKQMARVGVLMDVAENNPASKGWIDAFEAQLAVAGWQKERNVEIIYRWGASDAERLARYAEELVRSAPDVFMVHG